MLLADQDRTRWHPDEIAEAVALLTPLADAPAAPYLLQALIAAEHAIAPVGGGHRLVADRRPLPRARRARPAPPSSGSTGRWRSPRPTARWPGSRCSTAWSSPATGCPAARAELLARAGRLDEARTAYDEAIGRCRNLAERAHLIERRARL